MQLFFAKVLRSASEDEVKSLFSQYGKVQEVNLFRAFQGAPTSKGCGLVTMGSHDEAKAAIDGLDSKHVWEGMESPIVVKWMDTALQQRRREQHLAAMRQGLVPNMSAGARVKLPGGLVFPSNLPAHGHHAHPHMGGMGNLASMGHMAGMAAEVPESPPAGCAPDAIKLFVGNIPRNYNEDQLLPFFQTVGKVAELVVVRDKGSLESKGSAFVWYSERCDAERAILQFNLRHVLPDSTGEQDRPLVVRKAKARARQVHPAVEMLAGPDPRLVGYPAHLQAAYPQAPMLVHQYYNRGPVMMGQGMAMQPAAVHLAGGMLGASAMRFQDGQPGGSAQMQGMMGASDLAAPGPQGYVDGSLQGPWGADGQHKESANQFAASVPINHDQMTAINAHMYSIQAVSGAQLNITPGSAGLFNLVITGHQGQVHNASNLVSTVFASIGQME